jgi:myo-inositol-1(or 4)-monophosphatase
MMPIIENAGGIVTSWTGADPQMGGNVVAAATPELHAAALEILAKAS